MVEKVVLVNTRDESLGTMEKIEAHRKGRLHRAFSVFLFDDRDRLILQRRALSKYHSPGLWANTCCSHPREHESVIEAGRRRLNEEMGLDADLRPMFTFIYRAEMGNGLVEHELDHVLVGQTSKAPSINPDEVAEYRSWSLAEIREDLELNPSHYTAWFKIVFDRFAKEVHQPALTC